MNIKRNFRWLFLKIASFFRIDGVNDKIKRPIKNISDSENIAIDITIKSILDPKSKLDYNIKTQECSVCVDDVNGTLDIYLEPRNLKIINTVFGYDVPINLQTENYISSIFVREMDNRRTKRKKYAMDRIKFSLQKVLHNINNRLVD